MNTLLYDHLFEMYLESYIGSYIDELIIGIVFEYNSFFTIRHIPESFSIVPLLRVSTNAFIFNA